MTRKSIAYHLNNHILQMLSIQTVPDNIHTKVKQPILMTTLTWIERSVLLIFLNFHVLNKNAEQRMNRSRIQIIFLRK
jgi:hypothetical protein